MQTSIPQSVIQTSEDEFHTSLELDFVPCEALNLTLIYYNHVDHKYYLGRPSTKDYENDPKRFVLFKMNFPYMPVFSADYIQLAIDALNIKGELLPKIPIRVAGVLNREQYYLWFYKDYVPLADMQELTGMDKLLEQLESEPL